MTVYFNLTTSIRWRRPPVGVVRVERELARELLAANEAIQFCQYDLSTEQFRVLTPDFVTQVLDSDWCNIPAPAPQPVSTPQPASLKRRLMNLIPQAIRSAVKSILQSLKSAFQRLRRSILGRIPRSWRLSVKRNLQEFRNYIYTLRNGPVTPNGPVKPLSFYTLEHHQLITLDNFKISSRQPKKSCG